MQAELTNKVNALEEEVSRLKEELGEYADFFSFSFPEVNQYAEVKRD